MARAWRQRLIGLAADFAPMLVFWIVDLSFGLKPAIASSIAMMIADSLWRLWRKKSFTRLYLLICTLTLVFGTIDLLSATPFMLKYEAVITNIVIGCSFIAGARGEKPLLQEFAEQSESTNFPNRPDVTQFFRIFTLVWAAYFFAKAALYFTVGEFYPFGAALALRAVIGGVSLPVLILLSVTQGRRLFALCKRLGWLPPPPATSD